MSTTPLRSNVPVATTQGTLALTLVPRCEPPTIGRPAPVVSIEPRLQHTIEEWTRRFAQAAVEIVGGDRPLSQLVRWTSPEVYTDLRRRALVVARAGGHQPGLARVQRPRPRVRSVHSCFITAGIVETSIHVQYGERSRAIAARFERTGQLWICTALDFA